MPARDRQRYVHASDITSAFITVKSGINSTMMGSASGTLYVAQAFAFFFFLLSSQIHFYRLLDSELFAT